MKQPEGPKSPRAARTSASSDTPREALPLKRHKVIHYVIRTVHPPRDKQKTPRFHLRGAFASASLHASRGTFLIGNAITVREGLNVRHVGIVPVDSI